MGEWLDPYTVILFALIVVLAAILAGLAARRRQSRECIAKQQEPEDRIQLRDIRRDRQVDPKLADVVGVKAARLLEEALEKGLINVRLESASCPDARIAIDPVSGVIYCIEDEDKGYPLGGEPTKVSTEEIKSENETPRGDNSEPSS